MFDCRITIANVTTNSDFPLVNCLLKLCKNFDVKQPVVPHIEVAVIPARMLDKTGVQKCMPTSPGP